MTEQEFKDSIAIYNPRGGHRTGKIYNVKDYLVANKNLLRANSEESWGIGSSTTMPFVTVYDEVGWSDQHFSVYKMTPPAIEQEHYRRSSSGGITDYVGNLYVSFYAKSLGVNIVGLSAGTTPYGSPRVDIVNKTFVNTGNSTNHLVEDVGNGWVRVSYIYTGDLANYCHIGLYASDGSNLWTPDGTSSMLVSGLMLSEGTELKDYYPSQGFRDLTVTGGGGTRLLADGSVEEVKYFNEVINSNDVTQWTKQGTTTTQEGNESIVTEDTSTGVHEAYTTCGTDNNPPSYRRIEVKKVDARYISFGSARSVGRPDLNFIVDLDTLTVYEQQATVTVTQLADDWIRIEQVYGSVSSVNIYFHIGIANGTTEADLNYTGTGRSVKFRKPFKNIDTNSSLPYQVNTGTAQFPKIDYRTGEPAFEIETQVTNYCKYSYNPSLDTVDFAVTNATVTQDQVGIDGTPNRAITLTDNDTANFGQLSYEGETVSGANNFVVFIKKDNDETRFPEIYINVQQVDVIDYRRIIQLNTKTGAITSRSGYEDGEVNVISRGDWWEIQWKVDNTLTNRFREFVIRPAMTTTLGTFENTATGSIVVGYVAIFNNQFSETPILTNGSAVTRTLNSFTSEIAPPKSGSIYLEIELPVYKPASTLGFQGNGNNDFIGFLINGDNSIRYLIKNGGTDQIDFTTSPKGDGKVKLLLNFSDAKINAFYNGVKESEVLSKTIPTVCDKFHSKLSDAGTEFCGRIYDMRILEFKTDQEAIDLTTI